MESKQKKVLIVGGGSAGWMTAAYLSKVFGRQVNISLVESATIGTIGVGEATFSTIHLFFKFLSLLLKSLRPRRSHDAGKVMSLHDR